MIADQTDVGAFKLAVDDDFGNWNIESAESKGMFDETRRIGIPAPRGKEARFLGPDLNHGVIGQEDHRGVMILGLEGLSGLQPFLEGGVGNGSERQHG